MESTNNPNQPIEGYGYWDEYPDAPVADWQYEVANGDTRTGYWEYVKKRMGLIET